MRQPRALKPVIALNIEPDKPKLHLPVTITFAARYLSQDYESRYYDMVFAASTGQDIGSKAVLDVSS